MMLPPRQSTPREALEFSCAVHTQVIEELGCCEYSRDGECDCAFCRSTLALLMIESALSANGVRGS